MAPLSSLELLLLVTGLAMALLAERLRPSVRAAAPGLLVALGVFAISLRFERLAPAEIRAPLVAASLGCLLALPLALVPRRAAWAIASVLLASTAVLALGDVVYLWTYGDVIPAGAFRFAGQAGGLVAPAWKSLPRSAFWVFLPAGIALVAWARQGAPGKVRAAARVSELVVVLAATVPGVLAVHAYLDKAAKDSALALRPIAEKGFLFAHFRDLARALAPRSGDRDGEARKVAEHRAAHPHRGETHPWFGAAKGKSVLFVQIESLNAFLLDAKVDGELVMPTLNALCARSLCFDQVLDQTDTGRSSDADHLVMTSLLPLSREAVSVSYPEPRFTALPSELKKTGYATFSSIADHPTFWNAGRRHKGYGFETSFFRPGMDDAEELGLGMADGAFFRQVAPKIAALPKPYFAWLITLSLHAPYLPPPPALVRFRAGELHGTPTGSHLEVARYVDESLRGLLDALDRAGALSETVVVVYGDHGEGYQIERERLAEVDAAWGDMPSRVPLVVHVPGSGLARRSSAPMGLVDVAPTVLTLLGRPVPPAFLGRAAEPDAPREAARVDGQVYTDLLAWTGERCVERASGEEVDAAKCDAPRARAEKLVAASNATVRWELP